jgi:NAD(P)-dependent dehydrogenase (short-subunit alcohol dehydrogenase family)
VTVTGATDDEAEAARSEPSFRCRDARKLDVRDAAAIAELMPSCRASTFSSIAPASSPRERARSRNICGGARRQPDRHDAPVHSGSAAAAKTTGCIVNTASVLSYFGGGLVPGYSASKGGVAQLTKSLAIAYAADRIRVNAIAPGWVATSLTQPLQEDPGRSAAILARTPLGRWGRPDDIAGAAVFLCSPAALFITGAVMPVDGGYLVT